MPSAAVDAAPRTFSPISVAPSQTETSCQATLASPAGVQLTRIVELRPVVLRLAGTGSVGSMLALSPDGTVTAAGAGVPAAIGVAVAVGWPPGRPCADGLACPTPRAGSWR